MSLPQCLDYYCFVVNFEIGKYETPNCVLLFQNRFTSSAKSCHIQNITQNRNTYFYVFQNSTEMASYYQTILKRGKNEQKIDSYKNERIGVVPLKDRQKCLLENLK